MLTLLLTAWIPALCVAACVAFVRRSTLRKTLSGYESGQYAAVLFVESAAFGLQLITLLSVCTPHAWLHQSATPWFWSAVATVGTTIVAFDALLFVISGMRLQISLLTFADALTEFGNDVPWRGPLAGIIATLAVTVLGSTAAFRTGLADVESLPTGACFTTALLLTALTQTWRNRLPMALSYEWNNRVLGWEATQARALWGRIRPADARSLVDDQGMPLVFRSQQERANFTDPAYPLLRESLGFSGKQHFTLNVAPEERPHIVMMFLESFRGADVGVVSARHKHSVTPRFDALSREGVLWTNFFANGTITSRAMASAFYGVLPDFREYSAQASSSPPPITGLPQIFAARGYLPAFFSDGPLEWENKREFFLNHGFPIFYSAPCIKTAYPEAPANAWNFRDEYLMRFHAEWLAAQDAKGQPTFSALLTVSTHMPFNSPPGTPDIDVDVPKDTVYYKYLRTIAYTDQCVGDYIDDLRARGLDRKTIFIIMGDHGQQVDANNEVSWSGHYTSEGVRVPLLVYAPGRLAPQVIKETASQVDIVPTVLDMLDIRATHHAVGSSLVRENDARQAISIHPWAPGMLANCFGNFRYVYNFDARKSALYDMSRDPSETRDIAALYPDIVRTQEAQVALLRDTLNKIVSGRKLAPPADKAYLTFPRTHMAPPSFPRTVAECDGRARELLTAFSQQQVQGADALAELGIFLVVSSAQGLSDDERLELAQLLLFRQNLHIMGELTNKESVRLAELEERFVSDFESPAAEDWMRQIAAAVRKLARTPRHPELRRTN